MTPLYPTVSSVCMFCHDSLSDAIVSERFICLYVLHRQRTQQYRHEHMQSCALDSRSYNFSTNNRDCLNCHQTYFKRQDALLRKRLQHSCHLLLRKRRIAPFQPYSNDVPHTQVHMQSCQSLKHRRAGDNCQCILAVPPDPYHKPGGLVFGEGANEVAESG
jgi:hypothetical protein